MPQSIGDVALSYKNNNDEELQSYRLTKSSIDDSVSKTSVTPVVKLAPKPKPKPTKLDFAQIKTNSPFLTQIEINTLERTGKVKNGRIDPKDVPQCARPDNKNVDMATIKDEIDKISNKTAIKSLNQDYQILDQNGRPICNIKELSDYLSGIKERCEIPPELQSQTKLNSNGKIELNKLPITSILKLLDENDLMISRKYNNALKQLLEAIKSPQKASQQRRGSQQVPSTRRRFTTTPTSFMHSRKQSIFNKQSIDLSGKSKQSDFKSGIIKPQNETESSLHTEMRDTVTDLEKSKRLTKSKIQTTEEEKSSQAFSSKKKLNTYRGSTKKIEFKDPVRSDKRLVVGKQKNLTRRNTVQGMMMASVGNRFKPK